MEENVKKRSKKYRWLSIVLVLALLLTALFLDSRYRLVTTRYELSFENLPESFDGYRIVMLADLHFAQYGKDNSRLLERIKREQPDIITLNGDFIEKRTKMEKGEQTAQLEPFLTELARIAPCYFVSGNHEWASGELKDFSALLEQLGIKYLHNEFVLIEEDGEHIVLAGVEDPNGPADMMLPDELVDIIEGNYPDSFSVLLGHRANWLEKYPELEVDIILCGHAHGGVVRLPFLGGVFGTEFDLFPKYDAGIYNEGNYYMVLSRGLGGSVPMPRFLNNPEVVSITLRSQQL